MSKQSGFSLIELIITLSILMALTIAAAMMIRSGIDVRAGLVNHSRVTQRLGRVMEKVSEDIEHAYNVSNTDLERGIQERAHMTIFRLEKIGDTDRLLLTTAANVFRPAGIPQTDRALVLYEMKENKENPNRKDLYRGILPYFLKDTKQEPTTEIFARNIKTFKIIPWTGDGWSQDRWDTTRGDTKGKLPTLVRIEIEAWEEDLATGERGDEKTELVVIPLKSVVRIQSTDVFSELKSQTGSIKWF